MFVKAEVFSCQELRITGSLTNSQQVTGRQGRMDDWDRSKRPARKRARPPRVCQQAVRSVKRDEWPQPLAQSAPQITISLTGDYTFIRGPYTFKHGIDSAFIRIASNPTVIGYGASPSSGAGFGSFTVNARYTGNGFADFLLGYAVSTARDTATLVNLLRQSRHSLYFQDDWKAFPRLTLNLGFRYMAQTLMQERDGSWSNFDFATGTLVVRSVNGALPRLAIPRLLAAYPYETSEQHGWVLT
jgi:outer membrane receptor protein involved in Fe transport